MPTIEKRLMFKTNRPFQFLLSILCLAAVTAIGVLTHNYTVTAGYGFGVASWLTIIMIWVTLTGVVMMNKPLHSYLDRTLSPAYAIFLPGLVIYTLTHAASYMLTA
ncbi:hypothetical protein ABT56_14105 [Photobacterium aquae]|uniref:Uncharacterized protein n=1 Tax=Photobacterium aquae TaxID=1195763 RepID=A0A0J1GYX4_9GAMM|nr:hypothetical protein ABT56_14105 [Photobacterium aquae]